MPSRRDVALAALYSRLGAAKTNSSLLLTDDARRDAAELAAATDTTADPSAAHALGWFHWNRHLALPDGDSDLAAAVQYFASVYDTSPASVPTPIQQAIRDHDQHRARPDADVAATAYQAVRLLGVYQSNGELPALIDAIALFRRTVRVAPDSDPNRAGSLSNLGTALQLLFERTGDATALTEAIQAGRDAVAASPNGHPDRAMYLNDLGLALQALFDRTGDIETLTDAVQAARDAVIVAPDGHPDRARCLGNLGGSSRRCSIGPGTWKR